MTQRGKSNPLDDALRKAWQTAIRNKQPCFVYCLAGIFQFRDSKPRLTHVGDKASDFWKVSPSGLMEEYEPL